MIITTNIAAIVAAPSLFITANLVVQDAQEDARISYNNCLVDVHNQAIKLGTATNEFKKDVPSQCTPQRKIYYDIIYSNEKSDGISNSEADEYALEECNSVLDYIIREYTANFETKAELGKS